ncbi:MAG: bifunctional 5,10-methylenetetrahydrofolate dehydrogenase/5,10-methenyltetrahydrofolate cyclohydrolase [Chloroflexi bacterium]|nr:bifunctional 5,10-methylenetetrahydrofolate dehydrogenase/5,10-methenyltetrahydrofolate cyclohydrolase [Chloroflexota bacterium]
MSALILDGKAIAKRLQADIAQQVEDLKASQNTTPGLAAVLVGANPASQMYVKMKRNRCAEVGMASFLHEIPAEISQEELEAKIRQIGDDPNVHGILVQLPLPDHIDAEGVMQAIPMHKDVDGFHPVNIGRLAMKGKEPLFIPATPFGCLHLLQEAESLVDDFQISGSNALVIGRSNIVGMPMALLLVKANATVTVAHSRTKDIQAVVEQSDIVIGAVGRPGMVKGEWFKPGAVAIDVATVKVDDPSAKKGYRWAGDFEYEAAQERVAAITPVPGGVGPMTIAMLLKNTLRAAQATFEN